MINVNVFDITLDHTSLVTLLLTLLSYYLQQTLIMVKAIADPGFCDDAEQL
jgi:hypothetical protein